MGRLMTQRSIHNLLPAVRLSLLLLGSTVECRQHSSTHNGPFQSRPYVEHYSRAHHSSRSSGSSHDAAEFSLEKEETIYSDRPSEHEGGSEEHKPYCWSEEARFGQYPELTGTWEDSSEEGFKGFYDATEECPDYGHDFDCRRPYKGTPRGRVDKEFRQVFVPEQCSLRMLDPARFDEVMAGRRLIMFGDSIMRIQWLSLACLLRTVSMKETGVGVSWYKTDLPQGGYVSSWADTGTREVSKQFAGEFTLKSGGQVIVRDVGIFNDTLMHSLFEDLGQLKESDIVLVNWGAWYPRFTWGETEAPWAAWQEHMTQLFRDFLVSAPARVIWKEHAPQHFEGALGIDPGYANKLPGGPWQVDCSPASIGEFWYNEWIAQYLSDTCKDDCKHIQVLPIFKMTLPRHNSHFGSFGQGVAEGHADCLHWCHNVADWWNVLLYNMLV